jgi:hypothetical protein
VVPLRDASLTCLRRAPAQCHADPILTIFPLAGRQ